MSHDRAFIDHVVTSTLVFEGEGRVQEYVGGYEDWLRQKPPDTSPIVNREFRRPAPAAVTGHAESKRKLSFNEQREIGELPARIEEMEAEQGQLYAAVNGPVFYKQSSETITRTLARLEELKDSLLQAYARWDELDSRGENS